MAVLDHWNAVLTARELKRRPVYVELDGRPICVFRDATGAPRAVADVCPHRRMSLSRGRTENGRVVCPYHGWSFGGDGSGESPGTPKMHCRTETYEAREGHRAIWVRAAGATGPFPEFPADGFLAISQHRHVIDAPLAVVLDNFCEMEHTGATHTIFGYELHRLSEVTLQVEADDSEVRGVTHGPPKHTAWWLRWLMQSRRDSVFRDNWVTRFGPLYNFHEHEWLHPRTGEPCWFSMKIANLFAPAGPGRTIATLLVYAKTRWPGQRFWLALARPILRHVIEAEVRRDVWMLNNLREKNEELPGMKLSRFDKALAPTRDRMKALYLGNTREPLPVADARPPCA